MGLHSFKKHVLSTNFHGNTKEEWRNFSMVKEYGRHEVSSIQVLVLVSVRVMNSTVDSIKSLSRNNSAEVRVENDVFPSITAHRLQNAKNVRIGALNVNSLRNKIGAYRSW